VVLVDPSATTVLMVQTSMKWCSCCCLSSSITDRCGAFTNSLVIVRWWAFRSCSYYW
jgi:hypothetical protein